LPRRVDPSIRSDHARTHGDVAETSIVTAGPDVRSRGQNVRNHGVGHAGCPEAGVAWRASGAQCGDISAPQALLALADSSQALRSLAKAVGKPVMLRTMRSCGCPSSGAPPGDTPTAAPSNPEISTAAASPAEAIASGHRAAVRISIFPAW